MRAKPTIGTVLQLTVLVTTAVGLVPTSLAIEPAAPVTLENKPKAVDASSASGTELLVKCVGGPSGEAARAADAALGATTLRRFEAIGWHLVRLPKGISTAEAVVRYHAQPGVLGVEPNHTLRLTLPPVPEPAPEPEDAVHSTSSVGLHSTPPATVKPNDPRYASQWNLRKIGMEEAWAITTGSTNVVVAVLDSGVNYLHPDLSANMWRNPGETGLDAQGRDKATNGFDDDGNGYVDDLHGIDAFTHSGDPIDKGFTRPDLTTPASHGTACAGVIAAVGNNGLGSVGICWQARIMAIKIIGGDLTRTFTLDRSRLLEGLEYVLQARRKGTQVRIVSLSDTDDIFSQAVADTVRALGEADILCAFAAGNDGVDLDKSQWRWTGDDFFNVITVGGSGRSDELLLYNFGRTSVDLTAPGIDVTTTGFGSAIDFGFWGTSAACPHVAGAAALLCAAKPGITIAEMRAALLGSADPIRTAKGKTVTGGRLNVGRALQSLTESETSPIVIYSSPAGSRARLDNPIRILFNRPMDRRSVEGAFHIDPPTDGTFEWSQEDRQLLFHPSAPFVHGGASVRIAATATDTTGRNLDGNFDRVNQPSPEDDYVWTFSDQIRNDDFVNAAVLSGREGTASSNNRASTLETDEPLPAGYRAWNYDASVWFRWTPDIDQWVTFDLTEGTSFDTVLGAFSGEIPGQLGEVASNVNDGSKQTSRLSFAASSASSYSIVVAGTFPQRGDFTLRWYPTPPPGITLFTPTNAVPGQTVTLIGTNFTGTTQVTFNDQPASFAFPKNGDLRDLRLFVTVPNGEGPGRFRIETPHGNATAATDFTVIPIPTLTVEAGTGNRVILSWPDEVSGYTLQASEKLGTDAPWQRFTDFSVESAPPGSVRVSIPRQTTAQFYRLSIQ